MIYSTTEVKREKGLVGFFKTLYGKILISLGYSVPLALALSVKVINLNCSLPLQVEKSIGVLLV